MKITVYDGATTIGGNKIYVEENDKGVFLDFGMNFAKYSQYFQEFLTERSGRGIHDLIHLNLIPKINVYRKDLIPSDLDVSSYPRLNVEAVLLSHAHMDHCGNIGLLSEDIAIVTSPVSLAILKALRDSSQAKIGSEIAYFSPKAPQEDGRYLKSKSGNYVGRKFVCTSEFSDDLMEFISSRPGTKGIVDGEVSHISDTALPFEVRAFEVDHSIYGANAYIIYGDVAVSYTGDLRLHGRNAAKTKEFVKKSRDARVLIIEGTRTSREDVNESEKMVFENCLRAVEESKGIVIADFSPRNFERLETFLKIARKTGKELVVTAKDAYMLHAIECADGACRLGDARIYYEIKDRSRAKWETEIVMKKWGEKFVDPAEISRNPENYILCFSFYDMKHLLDIKPESGAYIYSSSEAFSEEQEFDFLRLHHWLNEFNLKVYGFKMVLREGKLAPEFIKGYHASGHASKEDLRWIIEQIDPDIVIPVHTTSHEWFVENFEGVVVLEDGGSVEV